MDLVQKGWRIAHDPSQVEWVAPVLLVIDAIFCTGIIWKVHYTEIDWQAYMQQIATYVKGERNYLNIEGGTGPLVYPGGHVYIYRLLYLLTDEGTNILLAQCLFAVLYLTGLVMVMKCYKEAKVPPIIYPLLILSKRLHSIFLLRLFNDGFTVVLLFTAIFYFQQRSWTWGSVAWSAALATKMSVLLALPGVGVIIWHAVGRDRSLKQIALMVQVQAMLGYEFLAVDPMAYLSRAFELSRQFMFKWTVNWRFVGEELFLSSMFSRGLLAAHACIVALFLATRWIRPAGITIGKLEMALLDPPRPSEQEKIARRVTPDFVAFAMLSSLLIGCLCARSLHYQFYAYIAWSTPFLLWQSGISPILIYALWFAQEWAWNVYPSTDVSSGVVVGSLAITLALSWYGTRSSWIVDQRQVKKED